MGKNLYYIGRYKENIISLLLNSDNVIALINPTTDARFEIEDILLGGTFDVYNEQDKKERIELQGHIFNYLFVPDTTTEERVFICIDTFIDSIDNSTYFNNFSMLINVYSPKEMVRLNKYSVPTSSEMKAMGFSGNRVDMLCDAIDRVLNGNKTFGIGEVSLASRNPITLSLPNDKYYGKCLKYKVKNFIDNEGC